MRGHKFTGDVTLQELSHRSTEQLPTTLPPNQASFSRRTAGSQVFAGHLIIFNTFGYIGSWGFFQSYYVESLSQTSSAISWVGSIQLFLVYFVGSFSGRALDAGYLYPTVITGCTLQIVGILAAAQARSYSVLFLTQGVLVGLGDGLSFCPVVGLISTYYMDRTRALAVSFAAAGAATGGIVFPLIAKQMLGRVGVAWTLRAMGLVFLVNSVVAVSLLRVRVRPRKTGGFIEWGAFQETPYLLFCVGTFLSLWGLYFAYYYISVFGKTIIHVSSADSFYLIMAINGVGIFGRIVPAWLVTRTGEVLEILAPVTLLAGILMFLWIPVSTETQLIIWIIFYGFFANAVQALIVGGVGSLTADKQKMGVRIGMVFTIFSFACLTGPPIAGALIDRSDGEFLLAQVFAGVVMVAGAVALVGAAYAKRGVKIR
ncbi:major facilitator superfamily domain-containing protein [Amylocarpus encephaloides]|uniref:Major facilitator superfamily domain-containing protein n=1 Tax=Amylocarpus encephaloides TaxID=45428 RepID=A0A9P8C7S9_9HELO|nr:major facilitator superfamily domain-containing protein [Amylocarpus encephaloides]